MPMQDHVARPGRALVGVTQIAGVRDFQAVGCSRIDEVESVAAHFHITQCLCDFRHVARGALAGRTIGGMVRVGFDGSSMRSVG